MGAPALAYGDAALSAFELDFFESGRRERRPLGQVWGTPFEAVEPVRGFRWAKGMESFAGWYYCVTARDHVGYESWLERDRLILMDRDPQVAAIASQPFWLHWHDGVRSRRHAPDYFVRLADGRGRVVDVRADDQVDKAAAESFAATEDACRAAGWEFVRVGVPDPVFMANVRWLARYRRRRCLRWLIAARLLEVFEKPTRLLDGVLEAGDRLAVLPVLFHLMWSGVLTADLQGELLHDDSWVWKGRVR
ncbi:TnsA-like heteromeric transposase endonuclease subunit [Actinacidiphila sp. ITFR-21]|uniref:TnsA-like heteromeric transposase endonuclease subunit n=1 Tax=Actinacidiphila sp. ITFR-21 TaxID=3075199 RepID=UPI00288AB580|nr:TnsA-like heteromeric transposase endonuclease subunit [Streptomyces sp. ITFR-21]WNI20051.1 TnsA-like heteromeric transposase endonuclease subunit [Streptomyces sp. ITFR-21]